MEQQDLDFLNFVKKLKAATAIDLALYKETQMKRRLTTFRMKKGFDTFTSFFDALMSDKALLYEFYDRMTINVSEFWRNANRWETLEKQFIPEMLKKHSRLKCWSAACSTGEEPYTLAMILNELHALEASKVIATDIDDGALEKARKGAYIERAVKEVPSLYLKKYFAFDQGLFHVSEKLKKAVQYQKGNLLNDSFEQDFDLIICRNVLIYFTDEAKAELYRKFSQALKRGGILFIGSTEQIFTPGKFGLESAETFFYKKL